MTQRSTLPNPLAALLVVAVCVLSTWFWVYWLPMRIGAQLPQDWKVFFDEGSTPALLILFLALPIALGALAAVALVTAALLLSLFVTRAQARRFMVALPTGGHIGRIEEWLLRKFKDAP